MKTRLPAILALALALFLGCSERQEPRTGDTEQPARTARGQRDETQRGTRTDSTRLQRPPPEDDCGGRGQPPCDEPPDSEPPPPPPPDGCGGRGQPACDDTVPPSPPPPDDTVPPPPGAGLVKLTSGQSWSGSADKVCASGNGECGNTLPAHDVTVYDFVVNGSALSAWPIGNNGLLFFQGSQTGASGILVEHGTVANCPPTAGGTTDKEHHAAITMKRIDGGAVVRDVEVSGCAAAFYFKYDGAGPILIEDVYVHDVGWGGRWRSFGVTVRNSVFVGAKPSYQGGLGNLVIEHSTFINSPPDWSSASGNAARDNVILGSWNDPPTSDGNCYLSGSVYDHFADPDHGDYRLVGQAAVDCEGKGAQ